MQPIADTKPTRPVDEITLLNWPDPDRLFSGPHWTDDLKDTFILNKNINAYNCKMERIEPIDYPNVFKKGVWVIADVVLKL